MTPAEVDERVCQKCRVYVPEGRVFIRMKDGSGLCGDCSGKPAATSVAYKNRLLSEVARRDAAGDLRCPVCNGKQFEAVRSVGMKMLLGFASLALPPNEVHCVTCGTVFKRG